MSQTLLRCVPLSLFATVLGLGLAACSSEPETARTFDEQVEDGGELFGEYCAECHGDSGQGTEDAPALVGEGALPEVPPEERQVRENNFNTAADVFAFADEYMPADGPEQVSDDQLVDVLAFALFANGITLDEELTLDNADEVVIHE